MSFQVNVHELRAGAKDFSSLFDQGGTASQYVIDHMKVDVDSLGVLFSEVQATVVSIGSTLATKLIGLDAIALSYSLELGNVANYYEVTDDAAERRMDHQLKKVDHGPDYYGLRHTPEDTVPENPEDE